jgi:hypothetical protein
MAKNYNNINYFETRPDIVKIFDDLEKLHDFCRFEMLPFNQSDLYNRASPVWNQYYQSTRPRKPRGEWQQRGEYNRGGNYNNNNNRKFQRQ